MKKKKMMAMGFLTATAAVALTYSTALLADAPKEGTPTVEASRLQALAKFTKVLSIVEKYYVDEESIETLMNKSIEGMMGKLDAHSSYLNQKGFKDLQVQTKGEFGGLGITVGIKDGALTVIAPIEGTPADKAGLQAGDIILKIDDTPTLDMDIDEAVQLMRGKPKTPIDITIVRKGETKPFPVHIIRDIIKIQSVYAKTIGDDAVYLRVTSFDQKVVEGISKAIRQHNGDAKGFILDLRNNPGGLLDQAVGLVDLFVDKGVIVSQKGRDARENTEYSAHKSATLTKKPLVVLVNEGSASASEIVSGALQDHKRAVLVGKKTFGKGSVQVILPISDIEAIKLTVARYYLPSGRTIQAIGVTPDVLVDRGVVPKTDDDAFAIKEADLKMHLKSELQKIDGNTTKAGADEKVDSNIITEKQIGNDIQLKEAIDILKALIIVKGTH
ncbi:S41 family peptidase [Thiomicrolovo sp. ZZH C-3]